MTSKLAGENRTIEQKYSRENARKKKDEKKKQKKTRKRKINLG